MQTNPFPSELFLPVLQNEDQQPAYLRLFRAFQRAILSGVLIPGSKLPASRPLAKSLGISRNTVKTAYEMLQSEGYIESRQGAGSFVSQQLPEQQTTVTGSSPAHESESVQQTPCLSLFAERIQQVRTVKEAHYQTLLAIAQPCMESYPWRQWHRSVVSASRQIQQQRERNAAGDSKLRSQIAQYLNVVRGVHCDPEQILICSGSQQALYLSLQLLVNPGESIFMEDPGYPGLDGALAALDTKKIAVPADSEGFCLAKGLAQDADTRVAILTPSRNFPMGYTLSLERRLSILQWAKQNGCWLIEDDYDSEFRFDSAPLTALQGLGGENCVIYMGTFSRILHHSLRLGYLVLPEALVETCQRARRYFDGGLSYLPQRALAEFMASGAFSSHVRRMHKLYQQRRQCLRDLVNEHLSEWLIPTHSDGSMHSVFLLKAGYSDVAIYQKTWERGLGVRALSRYYHDPQAEHALQGLVIGFAGYDEGQIEKGVRLLKTVLSGV